MIRRPITKETIYKFMKSTSRLLKKKTTLYLTGGSTSILYGMREGTIDIDIAGDMDELFSHISKLKEKLQINIEMVKPTDFIPSLPGEDSRHIRIDTFGKTTFMHFDPYAQAFSKIVRGHQTDILDVKKMIEFDLIDIRKLNEMVKKLSDREFSKYPRLNRSAVEIAIESFAKEHL